jgi:Family of unknown function (DUF6433)
MTMTVKEKTTTKRTTSKVKEVANESIDLPANPFAFEVLNLVSSQRTNAKKVEVLKKYEHDSLKAIFIWNFDESVISVLPEGDVPFFGDNTMKTTTMSERIEEAVKQLRDSSIGAIDQKYSTIRKEYDKFYNFIKGGNDSLNGIRRENIFVNLLEGLHPLEAEILCLCKDKKLQTKYKITKEIVSEAYPDITWGGRS